MSYVTFLPAIIIVLATACLIYVHCFMLSYFRKDMFCPLCYFSEKIFSFKEALEIETQKLRGTKDKVLK